MTQWCFLNDDFVEEKNAVLHYRDLSIQRGYGIFDFFKVINGVSVFLEEHLQRFYFSAEQMRLTVTYSKHQLKEIIKGLLQKNEAENTGVRITLTGGYSQDGFQPAKPNLLISLHSFMAPTEEQFQTGIKLITYGHQRQLPSIKTIDYLLAIWLQPLVKQQEADDVLYHQEKVIGECPRSNIFIVTSENQLVTPSENILKGIIRSKVIEAAKRIIGVEERTIALEELRAAKEVFITSTTKTILPVRQIDEHFFYSQRNISTQLYHLIHDRIKQLVYHEE